MKDDVTVLCTGDLHLGRHPTRIPKQRDGEGFSPKAVWRSMVQEATDRGVDAVLITGDIADRENRYFEAFGAFETGVKTLDKAGIPIIVVSGNHDFDVLPRMVEDLDVNRLELLGADGTWERTTIDRNGEPLVHVDGWSFPTEHVLNSPLDGYDESAADDAPVIGILHGDLDSPGSDYAPVEQTDLLSTSVDAWLLGHIHKPTVHNQRDPFLLYPGSPQALDPGERGTHGPWILSLDATGSVDAEQLPLTRVQYDRLAVDVSDAEDSKAVTPLVTDQLSAHVRENLDSSAQELLLARVRLTGQTSAHADLVDQRPSLENQLSLNQGSVDVHVEGLDVETRPAVDLEELAEGDSPVALIATLLLELENGEIGDEQRRLIEDSLDAMEEAHASNAYTHLQREGTIERPDEEEALATLERQAKLMLDTLLNQKEAHA